MAQLDNQNRLLRYLDASNTLVNRDLVQMNAGPVVARQPPTSVANRMEIGPIQPGVF